LPPYSLIKDFAGNTGRYAHLGDELVLTGQGQGYFEPFLDQTGKVIEENIDESNLTAWPGTAFSIKNFKVHSMDTYLQNLLPLSAGSP